MLSVDADRQLDLDWSWTSTDAELANGQSTHVQVRFSDAGDGTDVTVRHERLPSVAVCDRYIRGWIRCFDGMERLARAEHDLAEAR